jgi:cation diffusion facilitator family transporter
VNVAVETESDQAESGKAPSGEHADREKRSAALSSVAAAIFLTLMKLVVGILTGSLGILAEALHSGLDLVAAVVTLFAVRVSARPADREHLYGHGKVENLSALFEVALLLVTCIWIIYEAIQRLFVKNVEVEATFWAFAVMIIAIVIDASRSRLLGRVARKHNSQALEADALHFSTDIWSSAVVIVGLVLVRLSPVLGIPWLANADAIAAMGVAAIVVWVSLQLGRRAVTALIDGVPASLRDDVVAAARVPGVVEVERVRVRRSGPETFADVRLSVTRDASFERTQDIAAAAEKSIREALPGADVVVEVEPVRTEHEDLPTTIRLLAARYGLGAHGIRIYDTGTGGRATELHLEVPDGLTLDEAHAQATAFEQALGETIPGVTEVVTHLEPVGDETARRTATAADEAVVMDTLRHLSETLGVNCHPHSIMLRWAGGELQLSLHCTLDGAIPIGDAHDIAEQAEGLLRSQVPNLGRVVIHMEPTVAGVK